MKKILTVAVLFLVLTSLFAETGYRIEIELKNYSSDTLLLAHYYGDKQYIKDTALVNIQNKFVFEGEDALAAGVYLVVLMPQKNYLNILVDEEGQHFSILTDTKELVQAVEIKDSKDNQLFYEYLKFIGTQRAKKEQLLQATKQAKGTTKQTIEQQIKELDQQVITYQQRAQLRFDTKLFTAYLSF